MLTRFTFHQHLFARSNQLLAPRFASTDDCIGSLGNSFLQDWSVPTFMFPPVVSSVLYNIASTIAALPRCSLTLLVPTFRGQPWYQLLSKQATWRRSFHFAAHHGATPATRLPNRWMWTLLHIQRTSSVT